ncbi:cytochrome c biogenesis protein CcdA, partial [Candidatus Woesearchaeota archaeon]|nr:cytochrome c biogenesis protein CcdA [Candidatus Woesearchaeota archaeon]
MGKKYLFYVFIMLLLITGIASALQIPENVLRAGQETLSTATKVSLVVAFIGGILGFFTPCTIGVLPAYFAYSFETRKELVKATFFFFLGMATVTVPIGFLMAAAGSYIRRPTLALTAGIILLLLGIMLVFGKGFKLINIKNTAKRNNLGVYIFGLLFAIGFTPCSGPILASIIVLSSVTTKIYAALMFVVYSLGTTLPLFLLS